MNCYHCGKPPVYMYEIDGKDIPFCLDCSLKLSTIKQQELENNERWINYLADQMDGIAGTPYSGARFPKRPTPIVIQGTKLHNINVSNSVVGTINTGSIGTLDQAISALIQSDEPKLAEAFKSLSEAIIRSNDLSQNQKNELIESLSVISKEAATPVATRQNTVAMSLLEKAGKITALANDISDVCQKWWPILVAVFNPT